MEVLFLMLVELLGVIATVICTFTQISLMFLSFKDKDAALKVISLPSCLLVIISTSLWPVSYTHLTLPTSDLV